MKTWTFILMLLAGFFLNGIAQTTFSDQIVIFDDFDDVNNVLAADVDNDGDMDIFSSSSLIRSILLFKNAGNGDFDAPIYMGDGIIPRVISSFFVADLDNDGDVDIVFATYEEPGFNDHYLAWIENDGNGGFGIEQEISSSESGIRRVYVSDLDNDGDLDLLTASFYDNHVSWYENDGSGNFGSPQFISTVNGASSVYASDLDNDGDLDVISASYNDNKIAWYENDGSGNFGPEEIISTNVYHASFVSAADLDNDGDLDVLSSSEEYYAAWYENDGSGNFGSPVTISGDMVGGTSIYATDLDSDEDLDIISPLADAVLWYENDGFGYFSSYQVISTQVLSTRSVCASDLDNDGDMDVLSASLDDDKIAWYKNNYHNFVQPENKTGCENAQQSFTVLPANATAYQWQIKDGDIYEDLLDNNQYSGTSTATFLISNLDMELDSNQYRCKLTYSDASTVSNDAMLTVLPAPVTDNIVGNPNPAPYETCTYAVNSTPGSTYEWAIEGGAIMDDNQNTIEVLWGEEGYGSLTLTETAANGCAGLPVELQIIIDVREIANKYNIQVFPNPSTGKLIISGEKINSINILDQEGRSIWKDRVHDENIQLDLSEYARGEYFIQFLLEDEVFTRKLILK